jgi:PAS domain S-box-containing protein
MDLYVINASNMVEFTTYPPDQDLDFSGSYDIASYLDRIRNTSGFYPDRVVHDRFSGQLRKYAYSPTEDHQYILELGMISDQLSYRHQPIQFGDAIKDIRLLNPDVEDARLFSHFKYQLGNASFRPDAVLSARLDRALETRAGFDVPDPANQTKTRYLFVDLRDEAYASDVSKIAELTYSTRRLDEALSDLVVYHALVAFAALAIGLVTAGIVAGRLTSPIRGIVADADAIAQGDLDHPIAPSTAQEFSTLESSIAAMVGRLKGTIEQLRQREVRLAESEEKYRQLVEDANSIILRLGPDGTILYVNEFAERFFEYEPGELLGRDAVGTIVPEIDSEGRRTGDLVHGICRDPTDHEVNQNENVRKDGARVYVAWTNRAIFAEDGSSLGILCVGNDITRLKEAEDENRQLYAELEERVRQRTEDLRAANRELESFTYTVSHDLRSPLRAIDGYTYILLHEHQPEMTGSAVRYLDQISQNARRMARLIDDLLNFSRTGRQALAIRDLDLSVLVAEVLDDLAGERQGRDVRLTVGGLAPCRADPALLKQVFANLIGNALKFTRNREVAEIEIGSNDEDGRPVYYVRDNGVGFDQKYAHTLFQVFHRLHDAREYEGTGVGLAIVQRIIDRHGGEIWVESEPGRGTTFFFTLGDENGERNGEGDVNGNE